MKKSALLATVGSLTVAIAAGAGSLVVADGTDLLAPDDGAVYRIDGPGAIAAIAAGAPLMSPSGVLFCREEGGRQTFFVSDIGTFFGVDDGAVFLVGEDMDTETIWSGAPLISPFGMVRKANRLIVADFGTPVGGLEDGAIYVFDLDPDGDGKDGPYPLPPGALTIGWSGAPLFGPNQLVNHEGHRVLTADDSGNIFEIDLSPNSHETSLRLLSSGFSDAVGLAQHNTGFTVVDAGTSEVYRIDKKGGNAEMILAGELFFDQYIGIAIGQHDDVAVSNVGGLFGPFPDGEIVTLTRDGLEILWSGAPLISPFGMEWVKSPNAE